MMFRSQGRASVALLLTALLSTPIAQGLERARQEGSEGGPVRAEGTFAFSRVGEETTFRFLNPSTNRELVGTFNANTHSFTFEGLSIRSDGTHAVIAWNGREVIVSSAQEDEAALQNEQQLADLISDWRRSTGSEELLAFGQTVSPLVQRESSAGIRPPPQIQGCGWKVFVLTAKFVLADAACASGALPVCAATVIVFMDGLQDAATACGWCGFGKPC